MIASSLKVSVAISTYNLASYIRECIDSVLSQRVDFDYEIVIADDCSVDETVGVLEEYFDNNRDVIRLIQRPTNLGMIRNVATLALECRGDYIIPLDGDDRMLPGRLQGLVDFLDTHVECSIAFHELRVFDSDTNETLGCFHKNYYNRKYIPDISTIEHLVLYGNYFLPSGVAYRRSAIPDGGFYTELSLIEDYIRNIQVASNGKIGRVDEVLGEYRIHSQSATQLTRSNVLRRRKVLDDQLKTLDLSGQYGVPKRTIVKGKANAYLAAALFFLRERQYLIFREILIDGVMMAGFFNLKHFLVFCFCFFPRLLRRWNF
ncbi:MAG: glycosyltransferase [Gammaproteobacteria bacterium]|nr:glycosyltransferase [Gammaproteobacteria bacterium]